MAGFLDSLSSAWDFFKPVAEIAVPAAVNYYGAKQQANIMQDVQKKEDMRWDQYLNALNPPQEVLDTRFAAAKNQIVGSAPTARRRLDNRLASRGIKGKGAASPISDQESSIQDALNQAHFQTYGQYNVPNMTGPTSPSPSTGQLFGINAAQAVNTMYPYYWMNEYGAK